MRKARTDFVEWIDPVTEKVERMPRETVESFHSVLNVGRENCLTAKAALLLMRWPVTDSNKRHLRKAATYLQTVGIPVVSLRSTEGGYYIADTKASVFAHTAFQRKIANAMLTRADSLDAYAIAHLR